MLAYRVTKYTDAITDALQELGHATNEQILSILRASFPELSATTVHRATARLADRGLLSYAPPDSKGSTRYDINTSPHDHFICNGCDGIRDIDIANDFKPVIEKSLDGCQISGRLTVSGQCNKCLERTNV